MFPPAGVLSQQRNGFLPTDLTGLQYWQHFQDTDGLWQDSGRTLALTADGQTIGYSDNRGGSAPNGFRQTVTSREPTWKSAGYFDSPDFHCLNSHDSPVCPVTNDCLIGIAFKKTATSPYGGLYEWSNTPGSGNPFYLITHNATTVQHYVDGGYRFSQSFVLNKYYYHVVKITGGTGDRLVNVWFQGVKQTQYNGLSSLSHEGTVGWFHFLGTGYPGPSAIHRSYGFVHAEAASGTYTDADAVALSDYLSGLGS